MSTQALQDISNTREVKQREIMEELAQTGECFLCPSVIERISTKYAGVSTLPIHQGTFWFIKKNDFPYEGTVLHLLIVPKRHLTRVEELTSDEFLELQEMITWVNTTNNVKGASLFMRYGDTSYTGATLAHIHFHIIHGVAKSTTTEVIKPKLGYKERS